MPPATPRHKLSTTISKDTHTYLETLVETGRASSMAEAVDLVVARARRSENRARLERDTAAYFERLPEKEAAEESRLEADLGQVADEVDFGS
jgi:hypothetical protein